MSKVKQDFISVISVKNEKKNLFVIIRCIVSFEKQAEMQNLNILPYANIYFYI